MASIRRRELTTRRNGKPVVVYDVRWRDAGRGSGAHRQTFDRESDARLFMGRIEAGLPPEPSPAAVAQRTS